MCKGIQDSHGFWIPRRGFRIPVTGFQIFSIGTRIPDSNCQWDSRFLQLFSGFQTPGFGIPLAKISWIPESGFPCMYKGIQDSLGFWIPDSSYWIPDLFQWNLDSGFQMSVGFQILQLYSSFQGTGARIPKAKISWIRESVFPYIGRNP